VFLARSGRDERLSPQVAEPENPVDVTGIPEQRSALARKAFS
jgi:hypothetical protein